MAAGEHFGVCHAKKYLKADKLKIASFWQKKIDACKFVLAWT